MVHMAGGVEPPIDSTTTEAVTLHSATDARVAGEADAAPQFGPRGAGATSRARGAGDSGGGVDGVEENP